MPCIFIFVLSICVAFLYFCHTHIYTFTFTFITFTMHFVRHTHFNFIGFFSFTVIFFFSPPFLHFWYTIHCIPLTFLLALIAFTPLPACGRLTFSLLHCLLPVTSSRTHPIPLRCLLLPLDSLPSTHVLPTCFFYFHNHIVPSVIYTWTLAVCTTHTLQEGSPFLTTHFTQYILPHACTDSYILLLYWRQDRTGGLYGTPATTTMHTCTTHNTCFTTWSYLYIYIQIPKLPATFSATTTISQISSRLTMPACVPDLRYVLQLVLFLLLPPPYCIYLPILSWGSTTAPCTHCCFTPAFIPSFLFTYHYLTLPLDHFCARKLRHALLLYAMPSN